ncbi:MAG TPA: hypothetical protein VF686_00175 [Brevundimonas sp.]
MSLPAESVADVCVLDAPDDGAAVRKAHEVARGWPIDATVSLYHGERLVEVLEGELRKAA